MSIVPSQILYLEQGSTRLYAEAIQVVESRSLCWARPTLLIQGLPTGSNAALRQEAIAAAAATPLRSQLRLYDLKGCPDLIWPIKLFQIAFDIDFFALLAQLEMNPAQTLLSEVSYHLNEFIRSVWKAHPNAFPPKATAPAAEILPTETPIAEKKAQKRAPCSDEPSEPPSIRLLAPSKQRLLM